MTDQSPLSQGERLVDVFIAPSKTFTDILRDQSWWLPFLLGVVVGYGYLFAMQKQVGWHTVVQNTLRQDPKASERLANASPEARAQAESFTQAIIRYTFYGVRSTGSLAAKRPSARFSRCGCTGLCRCWSSRSW